MTVRRFRKTALIDAVQWTGSNQQEIHDFTGGRGSFIGHPQEGFELTIETLEGPLRAGVGSWIARGPDGECWPIKRETFEATYEEVRPPTSDTLFADLGQEDSRDDNSHSEADA